MSSLILEYLDNSCFKIVSCMRYRHIGAWTEGKVLSRVWIRKENLKRAFPAAIRILRVSRTHRTAGWGRKKDG